MRGGPLTKKQTGQRTQVNYPLTKTSETEIYVLFSRFKKKDTFSKSYVLDHSVTLNGSYVSNRIQKKHSTTLILKPG